MCEKIFELEKIFFLSAKNFEMFVESQDAWKPRKSQFSAQSGHSPENSTEKTFSDPPEGGFSNKYLHMII